MAYAIYFDETLVSGGVALEEKSFINPHLHLVENGAGELTFTIPVDHIHYNTPEERKTEVRVYLFHDDMQPIFCGWITEISLDFWMQKKVTVEGDLALLRLSIQRPTNYTGLTVTQFLNAVIDNHNTCVNARKKRFEVGNVDFTRKLTDAACGYDTTANVIEKLLIDEMAGILAVRYEQSGDTITKFLDYTKETNAPRASQTVELGQNIIDFQVDLQGDDIVTVVVPLGKKLEDSERPSGAIEGVDYYVDVKTVNNGNDYIIATDATSSFGRIWKVLHFDDVKKPSRLMTLANNYLSNYQFANMIVKIKAIDLALAFDNVDPLELSTVVHVISTYHGTDAEFRITEIDYYLDEPERNTITCGHSGIRNLSSMMAGNRGNLYRLNSAGVSFVPNPDTSGGGTGSDSGGGSGGNTGGGDTGGGDTTSENILSYNATNRTLTITKLKNTPTYNATTRTLNIR